VTVQLCDVIESWPLRSRLAPDWVRTERWDCTPMTRFPMSRCTQPVEQQPTKRIVLVGDSHLQQLAGAPIPTARSHGWQLIAIVRGACPFSTVSEVNPD
jgi:hypothetical protein